MLNYFRPIAAVLGVFALLLLLAGPASVSGLVFAASRFQTPTVRSGVMNCDRKGDLVVHCRIFDERHTDAQGNYRCNREIRMVMNPDNHRVPVTGLGRWSCRGGGGAPSD